MIHIKTIDHLPLPARVFYRVDYNVPLEGTRITDDTRIEETLRTLRILREKGCPVVIASHLGRPKGERKAKYSLEPVRARLAELLGTDVRWASDCIGDEARQKANSLLPGQVLLLENLRFHAGEEANDDAFAHELHELADVYVNDAFGACHRAHASIDALPRLFPSDRIAGGLLLTREIEFLQKVTNVTERPFVALLGGAKIAGKIEPLEALVRLADTVLIGGGMANTFIAAKGVGMGASLVDKDSIDVAKRILDGKARTVFNGLIHVHPGAQKTDAKQSNRNLLLSADAIANSNPRLEIFADDVRCTHGSTVGQLDADAVFYLRSRGIGEAAARSLLTYAFASDIVARVKVEAVRHDLEEYLFARLPQGEVVRQAV